MSGPEPTPTPPTGSIATDPSVAARDPAAVGLAGFGDDDGFNAGIFIVALLIAFSMHAVLGGAANNAPQKKPEQRVEMAIYKPPPPPPPPPETPPPPPPKEEPPKPKPKEPPKELPPQPKEVTPPPPSNDAPPPDTPPEPIPVVTGINLNSVVQGNSGGPKVRVGNTTYGDPNKEQFVDPSQVKPYSGGQPGFKAARASAVTKEAGVSCPASAQRYPKDLQDQGVEGVVQLLLSIGADGRMVNVRVSRSSGNKQLDAIAVANIKNCRFTPGEVDGEKVDTILRHTFKFELYD